MNWGLRIALLYTGFVAMIVTMVWLTMNHKVDLVSKDYYEQELRYQEKIDRVAQTKLLKQPLKWHINETAITIRFPKPDDQKEISGSVLFFKASDSSKDVLLSVKTDSNYVQAIPLDMLSPGRYTMQISWKSGNHAYYYDEEAILIH